MDRQPYKSRPSAGTADAPMDKGQLHPQPSEAPVPEHASPSPHDAAPSGSTMSGTIEWKSSLLKAWQVLICCWFVQQGSSHATSVWLHYKNLSGLGNLHMLL